MSGDFDAWRCSSGFGVALRLGTGVPALDEPLSLAGIGRWTMLQGRSDNVQVRVFA